MDSSSSNSGLEEALEELAIAVWETDLPSISQNVSGNDTDIEPKQASKKETNNDISVESTKDSEPNQDSEPKKNPEPTKDSEPAKYSEPRKDFEPKKNSEPKNDSEPDPRGEDIPGTTNLHQERVAFFEENFPLLFSDTWLSSSELHRFLEAERSFVPPPIPIVRDEDINIHGENNGKKKPGMIVLRRVPGASEAHFELGKLGAFLHPHIPKQKDLIPVPKVEKLRCRMPGEDAAKFLEEHRHGYYTFIANFYLTKCWDWRAGGSTRYSLLTSPHKIARITKHLKCTIEDYIEVFGQVHINLSGYTMD